MLLRRFFAWAALTVALTGCNAIVGNDEHAEAPGDATTDMGSLSPEEAGADVTLVDGSAKLDASTDARSDGALPDARGSDASDASFTSDANLADAETLQEAGTIVATCTADGGACKPATDCYSGALTCDDGGEVCTASTALEDGTACGTDTTHFCSKGLCAVCNAGGDCSSASTPCIVSTNDCSTGVAVCKFSRNATEGMGCGAGLFCNMGLCAACKVGAGCSPAANPCHVGTVSVCTNGVPTCTDTNAAATDGTSCTSGAISGVCSAGTCTACTTSAACNPGGNPCQNGTMSCSTGPKCNLTSNVQDQTVVAACGTNEICLSGQCAVKCDAASCPTGCCNGNTCVAVASETTAMCGTGTGGAACGACPFGGCTNGTCQCPAGTLDCGGVCAACATPPAGGASTCSGTACTFTCTAAGTTKCGSACVNTQTDSANCNGCGLSCPTGGSCVGAACQCSTGSLACGAVCAKCTTPANAVPSCSGTTCGFTCNPGLHNCSGSCVSNSSVNSCGSSCAACSVPNGTPGCDGTSCTIATCSTGYVACTHACATPQCIKPVAISAGNSSVCVVLAGGTVACWGDNTFGQLGNGTTSTTPQLTPKVIPNLTGVNSISMGGDHACAVLTNGNVSCWGNNMFGQLGQPPTTIASSPTPIAAAMPGPMSSVTGGYSNTCGILAANGSMWCWGYNGQGELGIGTTDSNAHPTPTEVPGLIGGPILAGTNDTVCALASGTVYCWGDSTNNEVGVGVGVGTGTFPSPTPLVLNAGARAIYQGPLNTCAVLGTGEFDCWGEDSNGEVGTGSFGNFGPAQVANITSPSTVAVGDFFMCALAGGSVQCWGSEGSGQLGMGTFPTGLGQDVPIVATAVPTNVVAMTAGTGFACATLTDGSVQCWGSNFSGTLGNGTTVNSASAVAVTW